MEGIFTDANIVYAYTRKQAIQDGILVQVPFKSRDEPLDVCFTANLWKTYGVLNMERPRRMLILAGLALLDFPSREDTPGGVKLRVIVEERIWVIQNLTGEITFLRPEDY
jgi:hypothetical protein